MRFSDYFTNDFETSDTHYLPELRTRYYRCRAEAAKEEVLKIAKAEKAKIRNVDDDHHEIFFETSAYSCIATVISPTLSETAVDFKVTTNKFLPLGAGRKVIIRLYEMLDKKLPFKGVALYK
ncbi:MAG TPA: hypothetical protein VIK96_03005 [Bacilli bacterium]